MPTFRTLPARPSLEYARKEAKALLRRLHAGDAEAISRALARHPQIDGPDPARIRLADAQLVIAREHGFASWPRLMRYIGDVERQQHGHHQLHFGPDVYEDEARRLIAWHRARWPWAGRSIAAYVPRFYGLGLDEAFAGTLSEDEARLAVARGHGAPSWDVFLERLEGNARTGPGDWEIDPLDRAFEALKAADLDALQRVIAAHAELLEPSEYDISAGHTLMAMALGQERSQGAPAMKPIMDWLAARGLDRQRELNLRLCGHGIGRPTPETVRELIDQGADPNWVAPNGIPVLEHALLSYRNGESVDVVAARTTPRRALWIAAGLGDVDGVRGYLDARGRPTRAARRIRPDFVAVGAHPFGLPLPDADDEEILVEALLAAVLNARTAMIEYLASRGAPINSLIYGWPILNTAISHPRTDVVACLVRCGADLDLRSDGGTPRSLMRNLFAEAPHDPWRRRLATACGLDPDALLAEINARPAPPPELHPTLRRALALASDDAARLGRPEVRTDNVLIGLLRGNGRGAMGLRDMARMDVERFHADFADRLAPPEEGADLPELPLHADAQAVLDAAIATVATRRRGVVDDAHLMHALTGLDEDPVTQLLARYGVSAANYHALIGEGLVL